MFQILVLSDLHLHHGDNESGEPSYLSSLPRLASPTRNPLTGIPDLLKAHDIRPDWILSPGDLGDKCDQLAQSEAWKLLETVRRKTHSRKLIGSVGNHDVDSRRNDDAGRPNDALLSLNPMFPTTPKRESDRFWREGFVCIQDDLSDINLVVMNSCEFHGVTPAKGKKEEAARGRISTRTIDKFAASLGQKLRSRNILLLHHHIRQHPWLPNENSHLENGAALLEVLKQSGWQWLVIHGHQHLPNLSYSEGGAIAPIVFSAGSLAAPTTVIRSKRPRNQMYCIPAP
ncbi:metallophosphoesterase family protein [Bradyrhizobium sp. USDA 4506]